MFYTLTKHHYPVGAFHGRRLIAAHFNRQTIFTLRFMTHAEYSKDHWKNEL